MHAFDVFVHLTTAADAGIDRHQTRSLAAPSRP
jgi:hypothetical protein